MKTTTRPVGRPITLHPENVLVIGDLHAPFIIPGYLEFCLDQQRIYKCGTVIFIGDIGDWHYSSFHQVESTAMGADVEYTSMARNLQPWFSAFPVAKVTIGNHDLIPFRKGLAGGLATRTLKSWTDLYSAPKSWEFADQFIIDDVLYTHGTNLALTRMNATRLSVVQGHMHAAQYVQWSQSEKDRIFAVQVGCGVDNTRYAFTYGKTFPKKPLLGCGVILNSGTFPLVIPFFPSILPVKK